MLLAMWNKFARWFHFSGVVVRTINTFRVLANTYSIIAGLMLLCVGNRASLRKMLCLGNREQVTLMIIAKIWGRTGSEESIILRAGRYQFRSWLGHCMRHGPVSSRVRWGRGGSGSADCASWCWFSSVPEPFLPSNCKWECLELAHWVNYQKKTFWKMYKVM